MSRLLYVMAYMIIMIYDISVTEMCPEKDYSTVVVMLAIGVNNFSLEFKKSKI